MIDFIISTAALVEIQTTKTGVIIDQTADLGREEYNELVKYLKIQNKTMCCG